MIIAEQLEWGNMFGYGDNNVLQLNKSPIAQFVAPNGTGKTSIALIIQELFWASNVKKIKKGDLLNRDIPADRLWANITFTDTDTSTKYKIEITRKGLKGTCTLIENGIDISEHKVTDTYKKIQSILKMDFSVGSQLTYQSSHDLLEFINATDTNRKKFLINLFNLERYINIGDVLKIKLSSSEKEVINLEGELRGVTNFLEETIISSRQEVKEVPIIDNILEGQWRQLMLSINEHEAKSKAIDKNNLYIEEQKYLEFNIGLKEPEQFNSSKLEHYKTELTDISSQLREKDKSLKGLDLADICYVCKQPIDNTQNTSIKNEIEKEIKKLKESEEFYFGVIEIEQIDKKEYESAYRIWDLNKKEINRFEQLAQLIEPLLATTHTDIHDLEEKEYNIAGEINFQKTTRDEAVKFNENVKLHNVRVETLTQQKREFLARQQLLNNDIIKFKNQIRNLNVLKKAFSTSGIVAFKLENLTKELEQTINNFLVEMSDGNFQVSFRLVGEKLNVVIRKYGKEAPVNTISGGEFGRIQASILLAIRSLLSKIGGNTINLLFLDEIMGVLDKDGREKLIEVLQEEKDLNVFLISHEWSHPLIDQIEIVRENKISRIEV